ncbi:hypothetical protein D3C71_1349020 [compost metagenome]
MNLYSGSRILAVLSVQIQQSIDRHGEFDRAQLVVISELRISYARVLKHPPYSGSADHGLMVP